MHVRTAVPVMAAVLVLAGCSAGSEEADAPVDASPSASVAATTATPTASASSAPGGLGCPAGGDPVPDSAVVGPTGDLDHDGDPDELWLDDAADGQRLLGVRTASGAVFSTAFESASPIGASAIGEQLDASTSIVLLSDGRQVPLYAVVDCELVATRNAQGEQYTFDLGFTGYGSGVTCVPQGEGGDLELYGLLVTQGEAEGEVPSIERTRIDLSDAGRRAENGPTDVAVPADEVNAQQVDAARTVRCGDQGPEQAVREAS